MVILVSTVLVNEVLVDHLVVLRLLLYCTIDDVDEV